MVAAFVMVVAKLDFLEMVIEIVVGENFATPIALGQVPSDYRKLRIRAQMVAHLVKPPRFWLCSEAASS